MVLVSSMHVLNKVYESTIRNMIRRPAKVFIKHLSNHQNKKPIKDVQGIAVRTLLEHNCQMMDNALEKKIRLSSIICTIGPASKSVEKMEEMLANGMKIVRLNFSHGTHEYHLETIQNARQAIHNYSKKLGYEYLVPIALDTKGPEIRTGLVKGSATENVTLVKGKNIILTTNEQYKDKCSEEIIYVDYKNITKVVKPKNNIYIDDGLLSLKVDSIKDAEINCTILVGGVLGSKKGVNLPGLPVDLPSVSEKDKADIKFGIEQCVDIIFASFIRNGNALKEIRDILGEAGKHILVISKLENQQGLDNLNEIIKHSDGIMVARGDMGVEIMPEKVFLVQKSIIARCNKAGKPGICATQMLDSMIDYHNSTRAEVSDVANAIIDGADCVMLSGETAKGKYVNEAISTMSSICLWAESCLWHKNILDNLVESIDTKEHNIFTAIGISAATMASQLNTAAIIVLTNKGEMAHAISRFRPKCPVFAIFNCPLAARQSVLYRGIFPLLLNDDGDEENDIENSFKFAVEIGKKQGVLKAGKTVLFIYEVECGNAATNTIFNRTIS